jgi:hypothetical protein
MKIFHLQRDEEIDPAIHGDDICFVIVAEDEAQAREIADEDSARSAITWLSPECSSCKVIGDADPSLQDPWIVASVEY